MFLRFLTPVQRQNILLMAYRMIAADGVVRDEETSLLEALRHELQVPAPKREAYMAGPDLSVFADRRAKLAAMLKLSAIAYVDRELHPEEVKVLVRFGKVMGLEADDMKAIDSWGRRHEALVREAADLIGPALDHEQDADALASSLDDGACRHLAGAAMPPLRLPLALGGVLDLAATTASRRIVVCFSVTAEPGKTLPAAWNDEADSKDSTPQLSAFRDVIESFKDLGADVVGLSAQTSDFQRELSVRLGLRFALVSDAKGEAQQALKLPTYQSGGVTMLRRLTLVVRDGVVEHVFYPVVSLEGHARQVLDWLEANPAV
jgi:peroxiredoxin